MPIDVVWKSALAGLFASFACGAGALPLAIRALDLRKHTGLAYAFAGGLMFAASVYNLILPGLTLQTHEMKFSGVAPVIAGILLGTLVLWATHKLVSRWELNGQNMSRWGGKTGVLIFLTMCIHSVPEGVAVGVGYASEAVYQNHLGLYIALAIAIHNIPEGLAVAIPMRAAGARISTCFWAAFLTSLPQPVAAVPASIASWLFQPIMPLLMGFAAGAMIFLVLLEMIPDSLATAKPGAMAWAFTLGFCLMLLVQVLL